MDNPNINTITTTDQLLASLALRLLETHSLQVTLVPGERGGLIRAVSDENPEFYRIFLDIRRYASNRAKRRSPGYRKRVVAALNRIVHNTPSTHPQWIGWELLDILHDLDGEI